MLSKKDMLTDMAKAICRSANHPENPVCPICFDDQEKCIYEQFLNEAQVAFDVMKSYAQISMRNKRK